MRWPRNVESEKNATDGKRWRRPRDTYVLSLVQRGDGPAYDQLALRLDAADDDAAVSIVSFEE